MSYFEDGDTVPPPFNMIPTSKTFNKVLSCGKAGRQTRSLIKKSREKAMARHDTVMRLLIRRYVTAEQRKRDQFGITEDDVMEIRQDISTLRYELIDILRQNGMRTPMLEKQDAAISGKKGRVMERRLQKDFQIGIVEGIVNAVIQSEKEPKDVFSQIAKAIGRKSSGSKKKDWNAVVRQNTIAKDPIGSSNEAFEKQTRRSIRRLGHQPNSDLTSLDPNRLVDYNPNLMEVSPTTRIAYAKFMMRRPKPAAGEEEENKNEEGPQKSVRISNEIGTKPLLKKTLLKTMSNSMEKSGGGTTPDIRTPSPIPEDPKEEDKTTPAKKAEQPKPSLKEEDKSAKEDVEKKKKEEEEKKKEEEEKKKKEEEEKKKKEEEEKKKKEEEEKKKKEEEKKKKEPKNEPPKNEPQEPVATTKLRGKSKATGQIMGGWI